MKRDINHIDTSRSKIIRNVISVMTVVVYILFSMVKRLWDNPTLYWLPLSLCIANCLLILETLYFLYPKKISGAFSDNKWIFIQLLINIGLIILILSYLYYPD